MVPDNVVKQQCDTAMLSRRRALTLKLRYYAVQHYPVTTHDRHVGYRMAVSILCVFTAMPRRRIVELLSLHPVVL